MNIRNTTIIGGATFISLKAISLLQERKLILEILKMSHLVILIVIGVMTTKHMFTVMILWKLSYSQALGP